MAKNQDISNRTQGMPLPPPTNPPDPAPVQDQEQHPSMAAPMEAGEEAYTRAPYGANGKPDPGPRVDANPDLQRQGSADVARSVSTAPKQQSAFGRLVDAASSLLQPPDTKPKPHDSVKTVKPQNDGIEVRANRPGVYKQARKIANDTFYISSTQELGDWMDLTDARAEKSRRQEQVASKQKALAARQAGK